MVGGTVAPSSLKRLNSSAIHCADNNKYFQNRLNYQAQAFLWFIRTFFKVVMYYKDKRSFQWFSELNITGPTDNFYFSISRLKASQGAYTLPFKMTYEPDPKFNRATMTARFNHSGLLPQFHKFKYSAMEVPGELCIIMLAITRASVSDYVRVKESKKLERTEIEMFLKSFAIFIEFD